MAAAYYARYRTPKSNRPVMDTLKSMFQAVGLAAHAQIKG
jgi:hypothetical protein